MTYNKTTWNTGDIITADKLNNIENGVSSIDTVEQTLTNEVADLATMVDNNTTNINTKVNAVQAASMSAPSNNYTNLVIGASGTLYNAPTAGFVALSASISAADKQVFLRIPAIGLGQGKPNNVPTTNIRQYIPVGPNTQFTIDYTGSFSESSVFRFIYAEGNKPNS